MYKVFKLAVMRDGSGGGGGGQTPEQKIAEAQRKQREAEQKARDSEAARQAAEDALNAKNSAGESDLEKANREIERLKGQNKTLQDTLHARDTNDFVREALAKPDANGNPTPQPHDFDAMLKFIDTSAIKDKDGALNAINGVRESHKFLFREPQQGVPGQQPAGGAPNAPAGTPAPGTAFGVPGAGTNNGGQGSQPPMPLGPDGQPDAKAAVGQGILGAVSAFRGGRQSSGG